MDPFWSKKFKPADSSLCFTFCIDPPIYPSFELWQLTVITIIGEDVKIIFNNNFIIRLVPLISGQEYLMEVNLIWSEKARGWLGV